MPKLLIGATMEVDLQHVSAKIVHLPARAPITTSTSLFIQHLDPLLCTMNAPMHALC